MDLFFLKHNGDFSSRPLRPLQGAALPQCFKRSFCLYAQCQKHRWNYPIINFLFNTNLMHRHGEALSYPVRTSVSSCLTRTLPPLSCLDLDQYTWKMADSLGDLMRVDKGMKTIENISYIMVRLWLLKGALISSNQRAHSRQISRSMAGSTVPCSMIKIYSSLLHVIRKRARIPSVLNVIQVANKSATYQTELWVTPVCV